MQDLRWRIGRIGPSPATVLILGERGTGKELVARALHLASPRRDRPFVAVNCAALPSELLASELFGHERGAFTGAVDRRAGLVASAESGTLFLDEIGDMPLVAQAMLLRFLQEREVRAVGSTRSVTVDVRVVAATNRDVERAVEERAFRADLLDRLSEIVLEVPPLRERRGDIPALVEHFVRAQSLRHGVPVATVDSAVLREVQAYDWPGNVRELEHMVSRAVILGEGGVILTMDIGLRPPAQLQSSDVMRSRPDFRELIGRVTTRQRVALAVAERHGAVRRADIIARFGLSPEAARRDLVALVRAGLLERSGAGRGTVYRSVDARAGARSNGS